MSFVYFLDVFDPQGLPSGLSDAQAAERQRDVVLAAPSQRLLALLTRIRQSIKGVAVNVVGGREALLVTWLPGPPPAVQGEGARFALWSLILPLEDDLDEISYVVPQLIMWAKEFGLRIYDAQQDLHASESYTVLKSTKEVKSDSTSDSHLSKGGVEVFLMDAHGWVHIGARSIPRYLKDHPDGSVAQACKEFLRGQELDGHFGAYLRRLVVRLEQRFPFQLFGQSVWCGRHPLHDPVYSGDGVRLIQVASGTLDDVLRHLLPLARELFLAVAVPSQNFYVHREFREEQFETNDSERLRSLDQCWSQHRLSTEQVDRQFQLALGDFLKPLGFVPTEDKRPAKFAYWRKAVDGVMHLISYRPGDGLRAEVISERFWRIRASQLKSLAIQNAPIVMMDFEELRSESNPEWNGCDGALVQSPELMQYALEDIDKLVLPVFDRFITAQDLWSYFQEDGCVYSAKGIPGFRSMHRFREYVEKNPLSIGLITSFYVARILPDNEFSGLLNFWIENMRLSPKDDRLDRIFPIAEVIRLMSQTPVDAPL